MLDTNRFNQALLAASTTTTLVDEELARDREYHPNLGGITRGGMANHYPMTILALLGLGASDEEVQAFGAAWPRQRARMVADLKLVDRGIVTAENWASYLGRSDLLLEFRRVFEDALARGVVADVVAEALSAMKRSLPMGLFHPLIRLSFAVAHERNRGLIADALAYMAIRYFDLYRGELPQVDDAEDATTAAAAERVWSGLGVINEPVLREKEGASIRICEELCASRALWAAALPGAGVAPPMQDVALLAVRLYLFEPSLTTLHAVTSAHALAELTLRDGNRNRATYEELRKAYWVWLTALYVEKGQPLELPVPSEASGVLTPLPWREIAAAARTIPEVHLIKLTYSLKWLDETFGGPSMLYKIAALNMLREGRAHPRETRDVVLAPLL